MFETAGQGMRALNATLSPSSIPYVIQIPQNPWWQKLSIALSNFDVTVGFQVYF